MWFGAGWVTHRKQLLVSGNGTDEKGETNKMLKFSVRLRGTDRLGNISLWGSFTYHTQSFVPFQSKKKNIDYNTVFMCFSTVNQREMA